MLFVNTNLIKMHSFKKLFVMLKTNTGQKNFICQQTTVKKLKKNIKLMNINKYK